jgi:hydrogenase maturation protein HypF
MEVLSKEFMSTTRSYPFEIDDGIIRVGELLKQVIQDVRSNQTAGFISARFHQTVCAMGVDVSKSLRQKTKINEVALSGGVWQNQVLLNLTRSSLLLENFTVYTHQKTPANDGGLALGQAAIANFK